MAKIIKIAKTIRNNWKKSTVAAVALFYGVQYAQDKYSVNQMLRTFAEEALKYGEVPLTAGSQPRHVTVILNPAAKDGKSSKLYEQYAAPLLHLAGLKVSLIQTEYEGQAKSLMEIMDNTDAILIAGGDGTLQEAVTGLMRRNDRETAVKRFPIGIIPVGKNNSVAKMLFWNDNFHEARLLAEAAMAVVREELSALDVMAIHRDDGNPVYAFSKLEWGSYRDAKETISKYWYWGPLKSKVAFVFSAIKKWPQIVSGELLCTPPCEGCSKCYEISTALPSTNTTGKRWWHIFAPRQKIPVSNKIDYSKVINENCGVWNSKDLSASDVCIQTSNAFPNGKTSKPSCLHISSSSNSLTRTKFINKSWRRYKDSFINTSDYDTEYAQEVNLVPTLTEGKEMWFSIDNENFEAVPVHLKLLHNAVIVYRFNVM